MKTLLMKVMPCPILYSWVVAHNRRASRGTNTLESLKLPIRTSFDKCHRDIHRPWLVRWYNPPRPAAQVRLLAARYAAGQTRLVVVVPGDAADHGGADAPAPCVHRPCPRNTAGPS